MKNKMTKFAIFSLLTTGSIFGLNRMMNGNRGSKNILDQQGRFFSFRDNNIYYSVKGKGEPLLLVHDILPQASGYEWEKVRRKLEKTNKVFIVDLPGCGRSEKPWITYTSFYFTEFLHEFIAKVIKEPAIVIASGASAFPTILADKMYPEDMKKLILVNPERLAVSEQTPDTVHKIIKNILHCPIYGSFVYNIEMSEGNLGNLFREVYFYRKSKVDGRMVGAYCEAAHRRGEGGRHLLASLRGRYLNSNVRYALGCLSNLCLIMSRDRKGSYIISKEYEKAAQKIETTQISGSKMLPQLETPEKLAEVISIFL